MFDQSQLHLIRHQPYRTDELGNVVQTRNGVHLLLSEQLVDLLASELDEAEAAELRSYAHVLTVEQAGTWHVPVWAGEDRGVYIRIPAVIWDDPTSRPPLKVRRFFRRLYNEVTE